VQLEAELREARSSQPAQASGGSRWPIEAVRSAQLPYHLNGTPGPQGHPQSAGVGDGTFKHWAHAGSCMRAGIAPRYARPCDQHSQQQLLSAVLSADLCSDRRPAVCTEDDVQQRVDAAVDAANVETEENLQDLLACLGQEERKTDRCA